MKLSILIILLSLAVPVTVHAMECPATVECPSGATLNTAGDTRWCVKGDVAHGPHVRCTQGELREIEHYRNGIRHGSYRQYSGGALIVEETYIDGSVHGVARTWHRDGQTMMTEAQMKHGTQHGSYKQWHANGRLAVQATYRDGKIVGRSHTWHPNGARAMIANYRDGVAHGERHQYHPNDWIHEIAPYRNGKLSGPYYRFSDRGVVEVRGEYVDGVKVGPWLDDLGRGTERGVYQQGKKVGEWRRLGPDGAVLLVENYENGLLHGDSNRFENGRLVERGQHKLGQKDGVWESYDGKGAATIRETFDLGMLVEHCETKRGKPKCEKRTPYRWILTCHTELEQSRFIDSPDEFAAHFRSCPGEPAVDWERHRIYVHRDVVDPYELRFAGVEASGRKGTFVLESHVVCRGTPPPPPSPRWIVVVVERAVQEMTTRVDPVRPTADCSTVP